MSEKGRMPRRDFILLPAICVATLLLVIGVPELIAEKPFYEQKLDSCLRPDKVLGERALPNCHSRYKPGEGGWVDNNYNECGYRSNESCLTKPADTFRVALIGSSTSMGYLVPYEETFAVRSEKILSSMCGHPVEFQSMGGLGYQWWRVEDRMEEAFKLKPDLVVSVITPFDMRQRPDLEPIGAPPTPHGLVANVVASLRGVVEHSALWMAVLHYRANLPTTYLKFFLRDPGRSEYLRRPMSPYWRQQVGYTDTLVKHLSEKARANKVPLLIVFVPLRAQAVLLKHHAEFPDMAPLDLDNAVARVAKSEDVGFLDFTPVVAAAPDINPLYYAVDDHLTGEGSALLADRLSRDIMAAHYPGLQSCTPLKAASAAN